MSKKLRHAIRRTSIVVWIFALAGCGALGPLGQIIQPPRFEDAGQAAEIRLVPPSIGTPAGGADLRLWIKVTNPNAFGFTLSTLNATLMLEGSRAATGDFPLGLPLGANGESIVPLDLEITEEQRI